MLVNKGITDSGAEETSGIDVKAFTADCKRSPLQKK